MNKYLIIAKNDDGLHLDFADETEMLGRLQEDYYGARMKVLTKFPNGWSNGGGPRGIVIFKGDIVEVEQVSSVPVAPRFEVKKD